MFKSFIPQFSNIIGHYYLGLNFTENNRHPKYHALNRINIYFLNKKGFVDK